MMKSMNGELVIIAVGDNVGGGTTILLDWQTGTVLPRGSMQVGVSWIPKHTGEYELRTFAISSFDNPEILSPFANPQVTISSIVIPFP